jgi:hypothetical protein
MLVEHRGHLPLVPCYVDIINRATGKLDGYEFEDIQAKCYGTHHKVAVSKVREMVGSISQRGFTRGSSSRHRVTRPLPATKPGVSALNSTMESASCGYSATIPRPRQV